MTITSTLGRLRQEYSDESELIQFKARLSYVLKIENASKNKVNTTTKIYQARWVIG